MRTMTNTWNSQTIYTTYLPAMRVCSINLNKPHTLQSVTRNRTSATQTPHDVHVCAQKKTQLTPRTRSRMMSMRIARYAPPNGHTTYKHTQTHTIIDECTGYTNIPLSIYVVQLPQARRSRWSQTQSKQFRRISLCVRARLSAHTVHPKYQECQTSHCRTHDARVRHRVGAYGVCTRSARAASHAERFRADTDLTPLSDIWSHYIHTKNEHHHCQPIATMAKRIERTGATRRSRSQIPDAWIFTWKSQCAEYVTTHIQTSTLDRRRICIQDARRTERLHKKPIRVNTLVYSIQQVYYRFNRCSQVGVMLLAIWPPPSNRPNTHQIDDSEIILYAINTWFYVISRHRTQSAGWWWVPLDRELAKTRLFRLSRTPARLLGVCAQTFD